MRFELASVVAACAVFSGLVGECEAELIRLDFVGTVEQVSGDPGIAAAFGDRYEGTIVYETGAPRTAVSGGFQYDSVRSFSAVIHGASGDIAIEPDLLSGTVPHPAFPIFSVALGQEVAVNGATPQYHLVTNAAFQPGGAWAGLVTFGLYGARGALPSSGTDLPASLEPSLLDLTYALSGLGLFRTGSDFIAGRPTGFAFSTVPAPSSIAALVLACAVSRRRRREGVSRKVR